MGDTQYTQMVNSKSDVKAGNEYDLTAPIRRIQCGFSTLTTLSELEMKVTTARNPGLVLRKPEFSAIPSREGQDIFRGNTRGFFSLERGATL
jgi:hypothetical protein